jgi:hypothetical protein
MILVALPVLAEEPLCSAEYQRGQREMGAWAEMAGVVEGVIYAHSLTLSYPQFCFTGTPKERVRAIATAFSSEAYKQNPVLLDDVPTKEQAQEFLVRFFPCKR